MSLARTGALPNSYKYFTIAVESFHEKQMEGVIYHESREGAAPFKGLIQMAHILNYISDEIHYPMKSLDERRFQKRTLTDIPEEEAAFSTSARQERKGSLATFRLHIKYRYNATWQGTVTHLETGAVYAFESFKELMHLFEGLLSGGREERATLGKRMCEVAVRNFSHFVMGGDVSHPAVADRREFASEFELRDEVERFLLPLPDGEEEGTIISPRSIMVNAGGFGPMTFVIRVMFRRNATWQGTICWKEKRRQISFRSFLEMLLLMQEAVADSEGWNEELKAASGHMG